MWGEYWIGGRNEEEDWDLFMWAGDSSIINSHDWASGFPLSLSGQVSLLFILFIYLF